MSVHQRRGGAPVPARHRGRVLAFKEYDMKPFFALYVKELKANKMLFLFLLLLIAGLNAYGLIRIEDGLDFGEAFKQVFILTTVAIFLVLLSLPFLLAHAFNSEWKSETHYQMFALPVSQYTVILAKVAVVASIGFVGGGIVIGSLYLLMLTDLPGQILSFDGMEVTLFWAFVFMCGLGLVTYMVFILGLVTGMEGIKFSVKRYRGLAAVAFFALAVFLYIRFFQQGKMALDFLGQIEILPTPSAQIALAPFVYTILMGVIFMIIGLVMYEKRAEI